MGTQVTPRAMQANANLMINQDVPAVQADELLMSQTVAYPHELSRLDNLASQKKLRTLLDGYKAALESPSLRMMPGIVTASPKPSDARSSKRGRHDRACLMRQFHPRQRLMPDIVMATLKMPRIQGQSCFQSDKNADSVELSGTGVVSPVFK